MFITVVRAILNINHSFTVRERSPQTSIESRHISAYSVTPITEGLPVIYFSLAMADKPKHAPPHGMEPYDLSGNNNLGALSQEQQEKLNKFKVIIE